MKKTLVYLGFPMMVAAAACTGGGDGDGGASFPFTSGNYVSSNAAIVESGCDPADTPADYNGDVTAVVVSGGTITVDGDLALTRSGNTAVADIDETFDLSGQGVDCVIKLDGRIVAQITGTDQATVSNTTNASRQSGAECDSLGISLPCTQRVTFDITKQ